MDREDTILGRVASTRRALLGALGALSVGAGGASATGGTDGIGAGEPDDLPDGLSEDGIDRDVLRDTVASEILGGDYRYFGQLTVYENRSDPSHGAAHRGAGDPTEERGRLTFGIEPDTKVDDPTEAEEVDDFFVSGEFGFQNRTGREPRTDDLVFDEHTELVIDEVLWAVVQEVNHLSFGAPEWDDDREQYVVPATELGASLGPVLYLDDPTLRDAKLFVEPDGLPVRLTARWDEDGSTEEVDITFVDRADWTEPPEWVAQAVELDVAITELTTEVEAGEELSITVEVTNATDLAATRTVTVDVGDLGSGSADVELDGGEVITETVTIPTSIDDAGGFLVEVDTGSDVASGSVTVLEAPGIEIVIASTNAPVAGGDDLEVVIEITNPADEERSRTISATLDGGRTNYLDLTIDGGETVTRTLTWGEPWASDEVTVEVTGGAEVVSRSVTVQGADGDGTDDDATGGEGDEAADEGATGDAEDGNVETLDPTPGLGIGSALAAIVGSGYALLRSAGGRDETDDVGRSDDRGDDPASRKREGGDPGANR